MRGVLKSGQLCQFFFRDLLILNGNLKKTSKDILFFREQQIYLTLMFFNLSSYLKGTENFKNSGYALSHIDFL